MRVDDQWLLLEYCSTPPEQKRLPGQRPCEILRIAGPRDELQMLFPEDEFAAFYCGLHCVFRVRKVLPWPFPAPRHHGGLLADAPLQPSTEVCVIHFWLRS